MTQSVYDTGIRTQDLLDVSPVEQGSHSRPVHILVLPNSQLNKANLN